MVPTMVLLIYCTRFLVTRPYKVEFVTSLGTGSKGLTEMAVGMLVLRLTREYVALPALMVSCLVELILMLFMVALP